MTGGAQVTVGAGVISGSRACRATGSALPYRPAMPSYRLMDGYGYPTDTFTADCDEAATVFAMSRAEDYPRPEPRSAAAATSRCTARTASAGACSWPGRA
ncbi:hypothetical protein A7K94_0221165 [Modestobacter sp. VKM Ac-2676]|nr:hypothetical protein A7K94_0221165 [Modestobacter sp. VKM Ac-2676]